MKLLIDYPEQRKFSFAHRLKSFTYAWSGIKSVLRNEHNAWIHLFSTVTVAAMGMILKIPTDEWTALIIVMAIVWLAEIFNTCIEKIMDHISIGHHPQIKLIKDMAAAAVLLASFAAVIVGAIIFIPKIF